MSAKDAVSLVHRRIIGSLCLPVHLRADDPEAHRDRQLAGGSGGGSASCMAPQMRGVSLRANWTPWNQTDVVAAYTYRPNRIRPTATISSLAATANSSPSSSSFPRSRVNITPSYDVSRSNARVMAARRGGSGWRFRNRSGHGVSIRRRGSEVGEMHHGLPKIPMNAVVVDPVNFKRVGWQETLARVSDA